MLLRSSSTPLLGSLISSIGESPNNYHGESLGIIKHQPAAVSHGLGKFSFHHPGSLHVTSVSCNSSPAVSEFSNSDSHRGLRRAQSEGNLEGFVKASSNGYDDLYNCGASLRREGRSRSSLLETIPSFSAFNFKDGFEDWEEEENHHEDDIIEDDDEFEEWSCNDEVKSEADVEASEKCNGVAGAFGWIEYTGRNLSTAQENEAVAKRMYLAAGLGFDGGNFGGGNDSGRGCGGGGFGRGDDMTPSNDENRDMEEYYKDMVEKNPGNSLFLRNYAQYLHQSKRNLERAEEYYSRAILADPNDGEIMAQYASLIWELHRDRERALSYFQRAVQIASEDSHIHAAYASFLWEIEDNEETEDSITTSGYEFYPRFSSSTTSATA